MKIIISILIVLSQMSIAAAQDTLKIQPYPDTPNEQLQEIDIRELPELIKQKLASEGYSSWILQAAYKAPVRSDPGSVEKNDYVVELKKDDDIIRIRFDDAGNRRKK